MKIKKTVCPYCNRVLSFSEVFKVKTYAIYVCGECRQVSEVRVSDKLKSFSTFIMALVGLIIIIFSLFIKTYLIGAALISFVFVVFYALVPAFISLSKMKRKTKDKLE